MLIVISVLPYKTPWLILGALLPLIIMAGWGVADFLAWLPARMRVPGYLLLAILGAHLAWQSYLANFEYYDSPSNPMVYAHPNDDVRQIAHIVEDAASAARGDLPVQVVVSGDEYWPLPWYLRRVSHVGWWGAVTNDFTPTPVILVSPDVEQDLIARLYESPPPGDRPLYVPLFERPMFLRPGREIRGYVTLELSNRLRQAKG
jgi:predicted membrane-bound mannosyltransferase